MKETQSQIEFVEHRGELMAELFLEDLKPHFVARPTTDLGYDLLATFKNNKGGLNMLGVVVKAIEHDPGQRFALKRHLHKFLSNSNIPGILLVIDVKHNRLFYWRPDPAAGIPKAASVSVPITEIDDHRKRNLRKSLAA